MPLYEYLCLDCKNDSEILVQSLASKPQCPECGSKKMEKQLSVIGSPVIQGASRSNSAGGDESGTCGKPQCARGCMFGN
jgi:putative FmdB family regulatory protein